ncbi:hypothetical protein PG994_004775 [Apiospora phragmitis]|uniref:ABC1 atypical kinase-like domain-containing protein n=1 Tax=Apiospora phragmitis TaxID=2905665 RepID=A0ABR1VRJ3_9PEZI
MFRASIAGLGRRPFSASSTTSSRNWLSQAATKSRRRNIITSPLVRNVRSANASRQASTRSNGGQFQPLRPPSPESLGDPKVARDFKRGRKWLRRFMILATAGGTFYLIDRVAFAAGISRSLLTFGNGLFVAFDYKINFRARPFVGTIEDLHRRSAERLFELLRHNGGLYLKIGQAIAMQSAVLPPEFQKMFARMFDDAPQGSWEGVQKVIREEFGGKSAEEVFGVSFTGEEGKGLMEKRARASASVAQVHWARLSDGREIAIKIQKPEIAKQIGVGSMGIQGGDGKRLQLETDFESEARNSETMRKLINSEPSLKGRVYVPTVYPEFTTRRILVTEWIEGVRLWDKEATTGRWIGGHGKGSPGVHGEKLSPPNMDLVRKQLHENPGMTNLKPDRETWRGRNKKGGLGLTGKEVMTTIVDLFSAQIFKWGVVHCDPHPGNLFIRRLPSGHAEVVLIDHGLYVYMSPDFRHQYSLFWKSLMTFDNDTIAEVSKQWGIKAPDFFASATLLKPYEGGDNKTKNGIIESLDGKTAAERHFEMQRRMKQGIRDMLADEDKWPKELIFIGRNLRIVQGNNQFMGSPVNRIKMMGNWASRSLFQDPNLPWQERLANAWRHLLFKTVLLATDVAFYTFKVRQWLGYGGGMEDVLESKMKDMANDMGFDLQHDVFDG